MTKRFKDIIEMSLPSWIMDMEHFDVLSEEDIDPNIAEELLELKGNKVSMANIEKRWLYWMAENRIIPSIAF